jgi:hypothetical protein
MLKQIHPFPSVTFDAEAELDNAVELASASGAQQAFKEPVHVVHVIRRRAGSGS